MDAATTLKPAVQLLQWRCWHGREVGLLVGHGVWKGRSPVPCYGPPPSPCIKGMTVLSMIFGRCKTCLQTVASISAVPYQSWWCPLWVHQTYFSALCRHHGSFSLIILGGLQLSLNSFDKPHKYFGLLFTSDDEMERESDRWIGAVSAVILVLLDVGCCVMKQSCWFISWSRFQPAPMIVELWVLSIPFYTQIMCLFFI